MDFGIAKSEGVQLTRAGIHAGDALLHGARAGTGPAMTPQADVYAFGILLFEMLTGQKELTGESVEKIFHQILYEPLESGASGAAGSAAFALRSDRALHRQTTGAEAAEPRPGVR